MASKGIFISYAHRDAEYVARLRTHLSPYLDRRHVELWDDTRILAGGKWQQEIRAAIDSARVAVLMISADFLASDYIRNMELPSLLERAAKGQMRLIPVSVGHTDYRSGDLWDYQFANNPERPLESLDPSEQNRVLARIARQIDDAYTMAQLAYGLRVVDATSEPMEARADRRPEIEDRSHSVEATYRPKADEIEFTLLAEKITIEDISKLTSEDREYIADLEEMLGDQYDRWRKVRKKRGTAFGAGDEEIDALLTDIEKQMCDDLDRLLKFIETMLGGLLQDHYGRYRSICQRL